jgi:alpha-L-fucosidase
VPATGLPYAWQTDTCIGGWHYERSIYDRNRYKSARTVIHMLADIVSKNGNLLLNIPVRGDGSIDDKEEKVLEGISEWMAINKESIIATRPWKTFGEGPASEGAPISAQGFNEGKGKPFTAEDMRFTSSKDGRTLYVIVMGWPDKTLAIKSLGKKAGLLEKSVARIELLGGRGDVRWEQGDEAATLTLNSPKPASEAASAAVFKLTLR